MSKELTVNVVAESAFSVKAHGVHTAFLEMVQSLRRYTDIQVRVNSFRRADITHIHTSLGPYMLMQLFFGRGKKVATAHVVPDSLVGSIVGAKTLYPLLVKYIKFIYSHVNAVVAVSENVKSILEKDLHITTPVYVQPNTIDIAKYKASDTSKRTARKKLGIDLDKFVVLSVGQIQPRKRYDIFVELAEELSDYQFIWVGGMPFKHLSAGYSEMKRLMQEAPKNVNNTGIVEFEDIVNYYHAADLLLHTAEQETFGLIIVEAAAAGLPVVAQDLKVYESIFGDNIITCKPNDLASKLKELERDMNLRKIMQKKSLKLSKRYSSEAGARRVLELYNSLTEEK